MEIRRRTISIQVPYHTAPLSGQADRQPFIEIKAYHNKDYKALVATASYIEIEKEPGYSILCWQTDWPAIRLTSEKCARYSDKQLTAFFDKALDAYDALDDYRFTEREEVAF